ncbi:MAG: Radical SAM domain-containing protein [Promethearchaeota archaeon CR_4]|nr:MAG: Radical SAM domain-containing protein [Candidatus Lokiarchaeota archaeon CR_4]
MNITLLNPHTTRIHAKENFLREPPSGLLLLAAVLENAGYVTRIIDLETFSDAKNALQTEVETAELLGLTCLTPTFPLAIDLSNILHQQNPNLPFIIGGPHASFLPEECFQKIPNLIAVVLGEGESQVPNLVEMLTSSERGRKDSAFHDIPGIAYKNAQGVIIRTPPPARVDVNILPLPARHLLTSDYNIASVIVNRGCPNQCSFCTRQALFGTVRVRSVENVLEELLQVQALPNYEYVNLYDNVNVDPRFLPDLCNGMQKIKFRLPWGAELRIDRLTPSIAQQMKGTNCVGIASGIETANDALLRANGKIQRISEVKRGIQVAIDADLTVQAYFVLGLPGETQQTFEETLAFIESSPLRPGRDIVNFFPATPYPGSRLWTQEKELGWTLLDGNYANWDCHHIVICPSTLTTVELTKMTADAERVARKYQGQEFS